MSTHLRTWGIALTAMVAFATPRLVTQAQTVTTLPSLAPAAAMQTVLHLKITAYSSSPDETDDTPFITADGTRVHDGIVATNLLPFGTKIMIPDLFGDKVFTVEDRMNKRFSNNLDIWMASKEAAIVFGAHIADIMVLHDNSNATAMNSISQGPSVRQL